MENKKKAGRPRKDFTANMDTVLQNKEDGLKFMTICVDELVFEPNVRHRSMWGEGYDPNNIDNYDADAIGNLLASMQANLEAGKPLCNQAATVWIDEDGRPIVQLGNSRAITMKTHFKGREEKFIVVDEPISADVKLQENTVRSDQHDIDIAAVIASMPTRKDRLSYCANIGWSRGKLALWLNVVERAIPGIVAYIRKGKILQSAFESVLVDTKLQELICDDLEKTDTYGDKVYKSAMDVSAMLNRFDAVSYATDLLPFMQGHEQHLKDILYVKQDGVYCDAYILDRIDYEMWYRKAVVEKQLMAANVGGGRVEKYGYVDVLPENCSVEPFTEEHWSRKIGKPVFYRHQFMALIEDKIGIVEAKVAKVKELSVPKEAILKEMRTNFVDEQLDKEDAESIERVVHTVCAIYGMKDMEQLEFIYELLKRSQRKLTEAQLQKLFGADYEEAYANAEQACRGKVQSIQTKVFDKATELCMTYCNLTYLKYVGFDVLKKTNETRWVYIDWSSPETVQATLEQYPYGDYDRHPIERMLGKLGKQLGIAAVELNMQKQPERDAYYQQVKVAMTRIEESYTNQLHNMLTTACGEYDAWCEMKEEKAKLVNVELSEEEKAEFLRTHRYDVTSMKYVAIEEQEENLHENALRDAEEGVSFLQDMDEEEIDMDALAKEQDELDAFLDEEDEVDSYDENYEDRELSDEEYEAYQNNINNDK